LLGSLVEWLVVLSEDGRQTFCRGCAASLM
jgi:hypothetical protein